MRNRISARLSWAEAAGGAKEGLAVPQWVTGVMQPMLAQQGDKLPVSACNRDGLFPVGTTQYEKRGVASNVP